MTLSNVAIANLFIAFAGVLVCGFSILINLMGIGRDKTTRVFFTAIFISLLIYNSSLMLLELSKIFPREDVWLPGLTAAGFCTYFFSVLTAFLFTEYVITFWENTYPRSSKLHLMSGALMAAGAFILIAEQIRGHLFIVYESGTYSTGHIHSLGYLLVAIFMVIDLLISISHRKDLSIRQGVAFGIYITLPLITILFRRWTADLYLVALGSTLSMTVMMIVAIYEHAEEYRNQEIRNAKLKVDMMMSQIQPHILLEILAAIKEIGVKDPDKAAAVIDDYSRFIRRNMANMSVTGPIPFMDELDYVLLYISLQQLRYGDRLRIHYTPIVTDFRMPNITMGPLVEFVIQNSLGKDPEAVCDITISTDEFPNRYEVEVSAKGMPDSGQADMEEMPASICNVNDRLDAVCGGALKMEYLPGGIISILITLPKHNKIRKQ